MRDLRYRGPSVSSCVKLRSWSLCFRFYYFPVLWKEEFQQGTVQDGSSLKLRRNLNIQENEKSVITNAYVPPTGLQMLVSCSPVFYLCACSLDVFIFKYILLKYSWLTALFITAVQPSDSVTHTHTHTHTHTLSLSLSHTTFAAVQSLSRVWVFVTPRTAACQGPLSFTVFFMFFSIMVYSQDIAYSSLYYAVGLCSWSILCLIACICSSQIHPN